MKSLSKLPKICGRTGLSRSSIYELIKNGMFPKPVKIGQVAVAWDDAEVDAWIASRVAQRDAQAGV